MKHCARCKVELPKGHSRKFCSDACFMADIEAYFGKPWSQKKRWYEPVPVKPVKREYKRHNMSDIDIEVQKIEQLIAADGFDFDDI